MWYPEFNSELQEGSYKKEVHWTSLNTINTERTLKTKGEMRCREQQKWIWLQISWLSILQYYMYINQCLEYRALLIIVKPESSCHLKPIFVPRLESAAQWTWDMDLTMNHLPSSKKQFKGPNHIERQQNKRRSDTSPISNGTLDGLLLFSVKRLYLYLC